MPTNSHGIARFRCIRCFGSLSTNHRPANCQSGVENDNMALDLNKIVRTSTAHAGWAKLVVATIRLPNGRTIAREIEDHGSAVCVLPYNPFRRTAVLVRQFRAPVLYAAGEQDIGSNRRNSRRERPSRMRPPRNDGGSRPEVGFARASSHWLDNACPAFPLNECISFSRLIREHPPGTPALPHARKRASCRSN